MPVVNFPPGGRMLAKNPARRILTLVAGLLLGATSATAKASLRLLPVTLHGYAQDEIQVRVALPCGARYFGLVVAAQKDVIKVAAAVLQDPVSCTTMAETVAVRVDYLATTAYRTVAPLVVHEGQRLRLAPFEQLQRSAEGGVAAVYAPRCGQKLGVLVHRVGATRIELGMAEGVIEHQAGVATCSSTPKLYALPALAVTGRTEIAPLRDIEPASKRSFSLRLATIDPMQTTQIAPAGLSVAYQRRCNEAPIGIVLGPLRSDVGHRGLVQLGVLVASYPSLRCADTSSDSTWQTIQEPALQLPLGTKITALGGMDVATGTLQRLNLRVPSRLLLQGRGRSLQLLQVNYFIDCASTYAVYGRDRHGVLSVGVLAATVEPAAVQSEGGSRCKKPLSEVSLQQPFVVPSVQAGELYPMRMKGM